MRVRVGLNTGEGAMRRSGHTGSGDDTESIIAALGWRSAEIGGAELVGAGPAARVA